MDSKIYLCKGVKLDRDYNNVVDFQTTNFLNNVIAPTKIAEADNYNFIGKTNEINVAFSYANCLEANYIAFQNPRYSNRWFFAWIDEVTYVNSLTTNIKWTIDAWSTFYGDWTVNNCLVLREHVDVADDIAGNYTQPENLEIGDYINIIHENNQLGNYYYMLLATEPHKNDSIAGTTCINLNGTIFPGVAYVCKFSDELVNLIKNYDNSEAIYNVYIIPAILIDNSLIQTGGRYQDTNETITILWNLDKPTTLGSYTPINKKLLTYPYCALTVSNNTGSSVTYKYENFKNNSFFFWIYGVPVPGGSIILTPRNYANFNTETIDDIGNLEYSLIGGKFPTLPWSVDSYTNWLTQNGVNLQLGLANDAIGAFLGVAGIMSANPVGVLGGIGTLYNSSQSFLNRIGQQNSIINTPNSARGNTNAGDIMAKIKQIDFIAYEQFIKPEYAEIVDNYFSRFGYKINKIKKPNITGRPQFNYIEISADSEIGYGNVPSQFMKIINDACRKGITIWHNYSNLGNYTINNR